MKIGTIIHRLKSCSSTNDLAKEMADRDAKEGTVIISEEQTKGRGTKGRSWYSAKAKGLYTSIILRPKESAVSLLPLVAGIGVQNAILKTTGLRVGLRWPNDLVWKKKKLGGILCESGFLGNRINYVILGIGLNISHERSDFPEEIRSLATSLELAKKEAVDWSVLLQNLWESLDDWYSIFCQGKRSEIIRSFEENLVFSKGERITVVRDDDQVSGVFIGIDSQGGLILEKRGKRQFFYSAEIKKIEYR